MSTYKFLPQTVKDFLHQKHVHPKWRNKPGFRVNGVLTMDAFKKAYEIDYVTKQGKWIRSVASLSELEADISKQTPSLWEQDPYQHWDVKHDLFTLDEMKWYLNRRRNKVIATNFNTIED